MVGVAARDLDEVNLDAAEVVAQGGFECRSGGILRLLVRATRTADPRLLTCHSTLPEPPMSFALLELADEPGP